MVEEAHPRVQFALRSLTHPMSTDDQYLVHADIQHAIVSSCYLIEYAVGSTLSQDAGSELQSASEAPLAVQVAMVVEKDKAML